MSETTGISWTDATFNPWWGCTKVSPACDNCYAERDSKRYGFSDTGSQFPIWGKDSQRRFFGDKHWSQPIKWNDQAGREGRRMRVFCASMADVMEDRADLHLWRAKLYRLIDNTPNLDWLLLTKRPQNFNRFLPPEWLDNPRPNVWGMTTVESQQFAWRIDNLIETPFAVRGLSCEPMVGPLDLPTRAYGTIHWVITGGESGPGARPCHPDIYRTLRDQAQIAKIPFHFKQHGEWLSLADWDFTVCGDVNRFQHEFAWKYGERNDRELPISCYRVGKKAAGRLLDGRTWDEFPVATHALPAGAPGGGA